MLRNRVWIAISVGMAATTVLVLLTTWLVGIGQLAAAWSAAATITAVRKWLGRRDVYGVSRACQATGYTPRPISRVSVLVVAGLGIAVGVACVWTTASVPLIQKSTLLHGLAIVAACGAFATAGDVIAERLSAANACKSSRRQSDGRLA